MNRSNLGFIAFGFAVAAPSLVYGASNPDVGLQLGSGWTLLPQTDASYVYDSNLYRQDTNKTSASGLLIDPKLAVQYATPGDLYQLKYLGNFGFYDTTSHDNYADNSFFASADINQTGKHRLNFDAGHQESHDPRGTARTETDPSANYDVDRFTINSLGGVYTYGAPSALLNLSLGADYRGKTYSTNNVYTRYLDYSRAGGLAQLRYRLSTATAGLVDLQYHRTDFKHNLAPYSTLSGEEYRARLGAQWQPSAAVTGRALAGYFHRTMDGSGRSDASSLDWELSLSYQPDSYSLFTLDGAHNPQESYFVQANFIDTQRLGGSWQRGWTDRFSTSLGGYYTHYKFEGYGRSDTIYVGQAFAEYDLSGLIGNLRQVSTRLTFDYNDRGSTLNNFDYSRYVTTLRINVAL